MESIKILRFRDVLERIGIKETSYRDAMADGLAPKLVTLGTRNVGLPEHELNQFLRAHIAGLPDDEIRKLVARIHADRAADAEKLKGGV